MPYSIERIRTLEIEDRAHGKNVTEKVQVSHKEGPFGPNSEPEDLKTPAGPAQVIGTSRGFGLRRPNSTEHDILYTEGQSVRIRHQNGEETIISAEPGHRNYQATPLDQAK